MDDYDFSPPTPEELKAVESQYDFSPPTEQEKQKYLAQPEEASTLENLATGAAQGLTFGFSDEILAALKAAKETAVSKEKGLKDLPALYRQYQQLEQEKVRQAKEASPYAYFAGELGGGILPALFTGGGTAAARGAVAATEAAQAAKVLPSLARGAKLGAGYGALAGAGTSEAGIEDTGEFAKEIGKGALGGATFGAAMGGVAEAAKAGLKKAGEIPFVRQLALSRQLEKEGTRLTDPSIIERSTISAESAASEIESALHRQGKNIDDVLKIADSKNVKILPTENLGKIAQTVDDLIKDSPSLLDEQGVSLLRKLKGSKADVITGAVEEIPGISTQDANSLRKKARDKLYELLNQQKLGDSSSKTAAEILALKKLEASLKTQLGDKVENFLQENARFEELSSAIPETIISKGKLKEIPLLGEGGEPILSEAGVALKKRTGIESYSEQDPAKLIEATKLLIEKLKAGGISKRDSVVTMKRLQERIAAFEEKNPGLLKKVGIDPTKFLGRIEKESDVAKIAANVFGVEETSSIQREVAKSASPLGWGYRTAGMIGRAERAVQESAPAALGKKVYGLAKPELNQLAQKLLSSPDKKLQMLGQGLSGSLEKGGVAPRAILFTILQSPDARRAIADMYPGVGEE